ncbi:P27 family phage terminase small subunit [Mesorhizobium sp. B2-2-4]|uniref:P27 family phage terminase small subunit n=1 Tax=unclassified Mesorhizobium TaxID=325217 RepID=UPI00112E2141|nr:MULTISPECIES: P27 family phage terminase small subunit [unclassified Mesorhizobium]TPM59141.1 P27 family phage terminase small subunit [Mesorhizobium sp. B2-2-4]TPM67626.1 P27 family phage terminase small subunit [Mesorhizobium sp. B2-2-1]TPN66908.1 P27 family phage terminase small subunit [Mesorhizobium sp. B1-1-3]
MDVIEGTGSLVVEPDWTSLFNDDLEIAAAREHWRIVTTELKDRQLLAAANGHSIQRLVCAYLMFDRMYREVAEHGVVSKPRRGNSKSIARISPYFTAMREAGSDASVLEQELGISPRRRGSVTKAERKQRTQRASDAYFGTASG